MYILKTKKEIFINDIHLIIVRIINNVIENNIPYKLESSEEPFINDYTGKMSYDYSGIAEKLIKSDLEKIMKPDEIDFLYSSKLDKLLNEIYINEWRASYTSNRGKNWISYKDIIEEKYNEWKYEQFDIFDEDGEYIVNEHINAEDIDSGLDDELELFIKTQKFDIYYARIKKTINLIIEKRM
jgi:hypothetical protein